MSKENVEAKLAAVEAALAQITEEISEQSAIAEQSGAAVVGLSSWLGNHGSYCTLTKECMPIC